MIPVNKFVHDKMRSFGDENYNRFLKIEVIRKWQEIVGSDIAAKVKPVTIEHGTLFVDVKNSAYKDQLKFFAYEIIANINEALAQDKPIVNKIRPANAFQIAAMQTEEKTIAEPVKEKPTTLDSVTLTEEEVACCNERAAKISDENLRKTILDTLLSAARLRKFRLATGWHKCKNCDTLCPPEELFCESCLIKERAAMTEELFKIIYDKPWLKPQEAQKILLEKMPHMERECFAEMVESARTSLIQKIAGQIRFGDEESSEVMKLVMLEKRLPPDKITSAIVHRTLVDLQFNLADSAQLQRYSFKSARR
ncbi:MAG: DUF721 domain-containing protein [Selenomonadaceae bacterium]|nr:DUF721 domain-containing protein [Selenomonadaceae bacterium]